MTEPTNGAAKVRVTMAVLNTTIKLQGQYTRERLDSLEGAVNAIGGEQRVLHDRISRAKAESKEADAEIAEDIAALKVRTGLFAGLVSALAIITSTIAAAFGIRN